MLGVAGAIAGLLGGSGNDAATVVVVIGLPLGIGIAILRHRLFDVELVLNRAIVYGVLSLLVVGVYAAVVFGA